MLGSVASLRSIASQARHSLDAADTLAHSVLSETSEQARQRKNRGELDEEEAGEVLEEEYAPLMGRDESEAMGLDRPDGDDGEDEEEIDRDQRKDDEEGVVDDRVPVRRLELHLAYAAFFVLGAMVLLSWNATLVSSTYYAARLADSFPAYLSWVAVIFTTSNLAFLAVANYSQAEGKPSQRILVSIVVIGVCCLLLALSTRLEYIKPGVFFAFLLAVTVIEAAGASYLQNATVALSSLFGPTYLQGILSGQGAIGALVSVVQLVTAFGGVVGTSSTSAASPPRMREVEALDAKSDASVRASAFAFFLISTFFALVAFVCHIILTRLPFYELVVVGKGGIGREGKRTPKRRSGGASASHSRSTSRASGSDHEDDGFGDVDLRKTTTMRSVEPKIRLLGVSVFWCFFVSLSVFPSITASILSVNDPASSPSEPAPTPSPSSAQAIWTSPIIFVALHFCVFNFGDWAGRALPQVPWMVFRGKWKLAAASAARTLFIPLFLVCNVQAGERDPSSILIRSDIAYMLLLLLFAVTNGYISTLIMVRGVSDPVLKRHEVDIAATCLAFYLTFGLALGSFASFAQRALLCHCNPFQ